MVKVYGTSHISQESIQLIQEKIDEEDPDIVALELDFTRLNALLADEQQRSGGPIFLRLIKKFQDAMGSKTGVMPGEEMLFAYEKSMEEGREVALIDQEISVTVEKLKSVRLTEKVKAGAQLLLGLFISGGFNLSKIPKEEFIDRLLYEMEFKFPDMYRVLVAERNLYMVEALKKLERENPEKDIIAFVGAAHRKEVQKRINDAF